jgi:hypothetical protein
MPSEDEIDSAAVTLPDTHRGAPCPRRSGRAAGGGSDWQPIRRVTHVQVGQGVGHAGVSSRKVENECRASCGVIGSSSTTASRALPVHGLIVQAALDGDRRRIDVDVAERAFSRSGRRGSNSRPSAWETGAVGLLAPFDRGARQFARQRACGDNPVRPSLRATGALKWPRTGRGVPVVPTGGPCSSRPTGGESRDP